ncbi:FtsQ-type POTRA domain-containing protein [Sphingomonas sp. So64.6b]|uniref:cell division protein FtsQ/DivIB n=1 Tax=Sphingomonas sp. So64.6b TaxID=2997354 RepID=UPI0016019EA2|nr:cell division protein FtsQ/DivIB [Sphingomonas sp. So64.6b]QNA83121.1 FtsQ-type POTRA domain-containing protein [Sphingomonas sp. So64.6b]
MAATLKRAPARRPVQKRKQPRTSIIDRIIAALPISEAMLHRIATWSITGAVIAGLGTFAVWMGVPGAIGVAVAEGVGRAGFRVEQIEVTGLSRMDRMSVYAVALDQQSRAMPLVSLEEVRTKLLKYGWIADAHVSRRLPDTLLVHIVERRPTAVWQDKGQLSLIAANGVWLEPVRADAMPDLPLVIGPGANEQEAAYQRLLGAAPALRPLVKAATWVGNRRWNLTFESGETLQLPEGNAPAAHALIKFAEMDGVKPLLGKGWLRFDMRDPTKLVARRPGEETARAITDPTDADSSDKNKAPKPAVIEAKKHVGVMGQG